MVQPCAKPDRLVITKTPSAFRYPRKNILGMSMSIIQKKRLLRRLLIHHLPLLTLSAAGVFLFYVMRPVRDTITRLSFATAYPALILMAATLLIGPLNLLRGK